jgi:hypothetical protein
MSKKRMIYLLLTVVFVALVFSGWRFTARSAYESAEYTVLESDGPFEIREYPDLMMATTNMQFELQGDDGSFMRLFRYISGANDREQKVAMTIPVFMESKARDDQDQMGFVIPKKVSEERVPEPSNNNVQIRSRIGGRFAVVRFSGQTNSDSYAKFEKELRRKMNENELNGDADAEYASYDPPWTPGPLRRNEILIRIK